MEIGYLTLVPIILLFVVINGYVRKNRRIPGPFPLPLIGGAYVLFGYHFPDRILYRWLDLMTKYNGTFSIWIGNNEQTFISKPEHVQVFCTSRHLLDHATVYDTFKPTLGDGLFVANGASWKAKRKAWIPSFHPSVIRSFVKTFKDASDVFVERLEKEVNGPEFQFHSYARDYSMDVIFLTQLESNCKSQRDFPELNKILQPLAEITHKRSVNIFLHNENLFKLTASSKQQEKMENYIIEKTNGLKDKNVEEDDLDVDDFRRKTFLRQLLDARKATKQELIGEIFTLAIAGYEATSHVLGFIVLMLGKHQDVQDKVFLEDQEIQRQLNGQELEMNDLEKYEYLDRVIKETLRLFPAGPLLGRKAAQDVKMGDITIRKGSDVICYILALHRNPEIYPNPMEFNPDNFLPERIAERHPYSNIPFSAGPRNCIGTKFAMTSLKVAVSALVRNFRLFSKKNVEDIKLRITLSMDDTDDFLIRIERR